MNKTVPCVVCLQHILVTSDSTSTANHLYFIYIKLFLSSVINNATLLLLHMNISSLNEPDVLFEPTDENFLEWVANESDVSKIREALRLRPDLVNKIIVRRKPRYLLMLIYFQPLYPCKFCQDHDSYVSFPFLCWDRMEEHLFIWLHILAERSAWNFCYHRGLTSI